MNEPTTPANELLTLIQVAELLKVKPRTLRGLVRRGLLPAVKLTSRIVRFRRVDVEEALAKAVVGGVHH